VKIELDVKIEFYRGIGRIEKIFYFRSCR